MEVGEICLSDSFNTICCLLYVGQPMVIEEGASADAEPEKQKYVKPIRCNTDIIVTKLEWTTETTKEDGETEVVGTETKTFDIPDMTISAW